MKATVRTEKVYRVTIDGQECPAVFTLESEWNDMLELKDALGNKIILSKDQQVTFIDELFANITGEDIEPVTMTLIKCSPELIPVKIGEENVSK